MGDKSIPVEPDELPKVYQNDYAAIFVYKKNDEVKVLTISDAKDQHNYFIATKWKHVATLEPIEWIEMILNNDKPLRIINDIKSGGNP